MNITNELLNSDENKLESIPVNKIGIKNDTNRYSSYRKYKF